MKKLIQFPEYKERSQERSCVFSCTTHLCLLLSSQVTKETKETEVLLGNRARRALPAIADQRALRASKARRAPQETPARSLTLPSQWDVASRSTVGTTTRLWCSTPCSSTSTSTSTCLRASSTATCRGSTSSTSTFTPGTSRRPTST